MNRVIMTIGLLLSMWQLKLTAAQTWPQISVRYFVVTAPTSPSNNACIQNVMDFQTKYGAIGLIPTDINNDPAALNMPHILRGCENIFTPANLFMWDTTNNPSGNFAAQNGQRSAWGIDWRDITPFLASDIWFKLWSSDAANTLGYSGNLATNTVGQVALVFSPTLRGELWDANGNVVASYHNGETVADHPINRLTALPRVGYYASDMPEVTLDLNYFRNQMTMTDFAAFYMANGKGMTNHISSQPYPTAHPADVNGNQLVTLEGQRHIGLTYSILETLSLNINEISWFTVETGVVDGGSYTNTTIPAYFRAAEGNVVMTLQSLRATETAIRPTVMVWNGPE